MIIMVKEVEWTEPKGSILAGKHSHQWHVVYGQKDQKPTKRCCYHDWKKIPDTAKKFMIERMNSPLVKKEIITTGEGDYKTRFKWTIYNMNMGGK